MIMMMMMMMMIIIITITITIIIIIFRGLFLVRSRVAFRLYYNYLWLLCLQRLKTLRPSI
jgi:hypothetical protein